MRRLGSGLALLALLLCGGCNATTTADDGSATDLGSQSEPAPAGTSGPGPNSAVDTTTGTWRGVPDGAVTRYLGIRYAQPPEGERRWALPEAASDSTDVRDADTPGPARPQGGDVALAEQSFDEDCLFVDVTVPSEPSDTARPVMVWWHGGGFTSGSGSQYDARRLAEQGDVIVVTVNYRLGMLGYLALPGLPGAGNFGLADQIESLRWANANAEAFGGDPDSITLFGESAGATSICAALTSPSLDEDLVDRVILSSGNCSLAWPEGTLFPGLPAVRSTLPLEAAETLSTPAVEAVGCAGADSLACLRGTPVEDLVAQSVTYANPLAFGTDLVPQDPAAAVVAGDVLTVPTISGGNRDEHRSFIGGLLLTEPDAVSEANYADLVQASFGTAADVVLDRYPLEGEDSAPLVWSDLVTDVAWACPTARERRAFTAAGAPVFGYEFADETAPDVNGAGESGLPQGAAHATDLPYLFDLGGEDLLTGEGQSELADTMVQLWTSFAHTGEPTADGVDWPQATADTAQVLSLGNPDVGLIDAAAEHQCGFWDEQASTATE